MPDLSLKKALSDAITQTIYIVIIFLVIVIIIWIIQRLLIYILIERGWLERIRNKLDNSPLFKKIVWILNPDLDLYNKPEKTTGDSSIDQGLEFISKDNGKICIIKYKGKTATIKKGRALIVNYFYNNKNIENITHKDFSNWLITNKIEGVKNDSVSFRQSIEKINKKVNKDLKLVKSIIKKARKSKKNLTEINFYKYEIIFK